MREADPIFYSAYTALAVMACRPAFGVLDRTERSTDGAQQGFWAQSNQFGAFSKPPPIGGIMQLSTGLFGQSVTAAQRPCLVLHAATAAVIFACARRIGPPSLAWLAAHLCLVAAAVALESALVTTDIPLLLAAAMALGAKLRAGAADATGRGGRGAAVSALASSSCRPSRADLLLSLRIVFAVIAPHLAAIRQHEFVEGVAPSVNLLAHRMGELAIFLLPAGVLCKVMTGKARGDDLRLMAYLLLWAAVACGLVVTCILKSHIGRARPDTLANVSGPSQVTPSWPVVADRVRNCSFASGEAAMAASLAIPAVTILWPHLSRTPGRLQAVLKTATDIAFTLVRRIGPRRHFRNDAVFSVLFAAGFALATCPAPGISRARKHLPLLAHRRRAPELAEQRGVS